MAESTFTSAGVLADTRRGLLDNPPWLSSLYFYDDRGSKLFEQITGTPEYYPTRTELKLLESHGRAILERVGTDQIAELGSGSSTKTRTLLEQLTKLHDGGTYVPVDVSAEFLDRVALGLRSAFPSLAVEPLAAEYGAGLEQIGQRTGRKLVLFLGSSIGNFEPDEQVGLLKAARRALATDDYFLLGTDLVKDAHVLEAAYNDADQFTAQFNQNILVHLNHLLSSDNDPTHWKHVALWNSERSRIEMHLEATRDCTLSFAGGDVERSFEQGERIHTENSYKFTPRQIETLAADSGWSVDGTWTDDQNWFQLTLLRA